MTIEPEFLIIAGLIFVLTASVWLYREGRLILAALFKSRPNSDRLRSLDAPRLLTVLPVIATGGLHTERAVAVPAVPASAVAPNGQLSCLSRIVHSAIATADRAERLHRSAGEQLDSAHYALQSLLDELSSVMTISTPSLGRRDNRLAIRPTAALARLPIAA